MSKMSEVDLANNYLIKTPKDFESFKSFLVKYKRIRREDRILREIKVLPYKIIVQSSYRNLFKYTLRPCDGGYSKILIKDLIENEELSLHIYNILKEI